MNAFVLLLVAGTCALRQDYYWREYTGTIPSDAVVGGTDVNGDNVYIGQAFVKEYGLITVQINPGVQTVDAPIFGIKKVDDHIKILCGLQSNFFWIPGNATHLHLTVIGKHAVIGGHEEKLGNYNVGRLSRDGGVKIGKINSFWTGNAVFYYSNKGELASATIYQVLVYEDEIGNGVLRDF